MATIHSTRKMPPKSPTDCRFRTKKLKFRAMNSAPARSISKRGRVGEGRPTKRSPEVIAKIAEAVAKGLTDEEAALLAGINPDTMTEWRKDPEFSGAIKRARGRV